MAAPTTAAFATGEGPGVSAAPTTAAFATGAPMTPVRPTRAALRVSQSPVVAVSSASIDAMMAWIGMRPLAIS